MRFFSDNAAAACPEAMAAIVEANRIDTAYDGDAWSGRLNQAFSDLFGTEVEALWVSTGTAANSLALAALCPAARRHRLPSRRPYPERRMRRARILHPRRQADARRRRRRQAVAADRQRLPRERPRRRPPGPAGAPCRSPTRPNMACVYTPDETAALGELCRARGLGFHVDGARFANAVASLGCSPAELSWQAGVDALSFGFVKNGGLSAEVLIFFRTGAGGGDPLPAQARPAICCPRAAISPPRSWRCSRTMSGSAMPVPPMRPRRGSPRRPAPSGCCCRSRPTRCSCGSRADEAAALRDLGFDFYDWGPGEARLVTSWDSDPAAVDALAAAISAL